MTCSLLANACPHDTLLVFATWFLLFLLCCGDVEPHPGPRCRKKSRSNLCWWNLNTGGAHSAWELLDTASETQVDVITIQESQMHDNEYTAYSKRAWEYGYTAQVSAGPPTRDRWGHSRAKGGVITLIRRQLAHAHAFSIHGKGGQAVASWIDGTLCINVYVAHSDEQTCFFDEIYQSFLAIAIDAPFIFVGDWNTVPADNVMFALLQDVNGWELSPNEPTRWRGTRVIDYAICNFARQSAAICLLPHAFSDHRLIEMTFENSFREIQQVQLQSTFRYLPPDGVAKSVWQTTFGSHWTARAWTFRGNIRNQQDCDSIWSDLMTTLEDCCMQTARAVSPIPPLNDTKMHASKFRPKSTAPRFVVTANQNKHPEKHLPSLCLRQLRNVLARLREIQSYSLRGSVHPQSEALYMKCSRVVALPNVSIDEQIRFVQTLITQRHSHEKYTRIKSWKERLLSCDLTTFKWLRGFNKVVKYTLFEHENGPASQSVQDALQFLKNYWVSVWNRPLPDQDTAHEFVNQHIVQADATVWELLTANDMFLAAKKQRNRAAGMDGWHGDEVSILPLSFWTSVTPLFNEFERCGYIPQDWRDIRQTHLPKPGKGVRESDHAIHVSSLRPVSILSTWYRLHATARWRSPSVQTWIDSWWPSTAFGGRKGKSIHDALDVILSSADNGQFVGAFDYSLAFDMAEPSLAIYVLKRVGMPSHWAHLLLSLWSQQRRYLQFAGETLPDLQTVRHSLPQGDPWSLIGMSALLLAPTLASQNIPGVSCVTFVDDRTILAHDPQSCVQAAQAWQTWSAILGLRENMDKEQYFHKDAAQRIQLSRLGVAEAKISASPKILGSFLCGTQERSLHEAEKKRVASATTAVLRCSFLPHPPQKKFFFASAVGVSKAAFGWKHKLPPQDILKPFHNALKRCTWPHPSGSPHLAQLLRGHHVDFDFRIMCDTLSFWFKKKLQGKQPPSWQARSRQRVVVSQLLDAVGWTSIAPWTWKHEYMNFSFSLLPGNSDCTDVQHFRHVLRESRRHQLFNQWKSSGRIDANLCQRVRYFPNRCKNARQVAFQSAHTFAVLTGASISPMHVATRLLRNPRTRDRVPNDYAFCQTCQQANDFDHWNWKCRGFSAHRPNIQRDPMQKRLGWPRSNMTQQCHLVLNHLSTRRDAAIKWRLFHSM